MRKKWREFWYCSDGTFNRASVVKAAILIPLSPAMVFLLGPSYIATTLVSWFIGDHYCDDDKEEVQIVLFTVTLVIWILVLAATGPGAQS